MADITDLQPVSREEFAAEMVPCLALTSGIGFSHEDQRTWLNAAFRALDGVPIALLKRGAKEAMCKADHPSKIVPEIMKSIREDWEWRKARAQKMAPQPMLMRHETEDEKRERLEVAELMGNLAKRLSASQDGT